ncbi:MAG: hypothetical protein KF858_05125 [Candidatus Sumerlaeia bacterium]|nr:hypothetical protein [Candidatus Sumerlaeia bacterium]
MSELPQPIVPNLGSPETPEPLLPVMICLIPLHEINSALACCRTLHGHAITAEATEYLEGELIDDNVARLGMTQVAAVEWGPTCWADEEYQASIYTLPIPAHGMMVVVRWWDGAPRWWSHGASTSAIDGVIESLERKVGRTCNRVVGHPPA